MKVKNRLLAVGSAIGLALAVSGANAATFIQGGATWTSGPTTQYSKPGQAFSFSFSLDDVLGANNFAQNVTDFQYSLGGNPVSTVLKSIQFFNTGDDGMFNLNFDNGFVSIFGRDVSGLGDNPLYYNNDVTASVNGRGFASGSVQVTSVGAVPEPGTWALMILGFGAMGVAMRRRRVRTQVSYA